MLRKMFQIGASQFASMQHGSRGVMRTVQLAVVCVGLMVVAAGQVQAGVISNGSLTVDIRNDNGAINQVLFGGADFFNPGSSVSDFGFQVGTNTGTFRINRTNGSTGQAVSVSPSNVVTGNYNAGGANVNFARSYSLVSGLDVLRITTNFQNLGGDLTLSYFDTFDPDQGVNFALGFGTFNDVFSLGGGTVGQARISSGLTVIAGSVDSRVTVASGNPFNIGSGSALNDFFASSFDGNDSFADSGTHIGIRTFLGSGQTTSYTYDLAFGLSPLTAQEAFIQANSIAPVPEPASLAVFGIGACIAGFGAARRRRSEKLQAATA